MYCMNGVKGHAPVNQGSNYPEMLPNLASVALDSHQKIDLNFQEIQIAYFVIALLMPIGALVPYLLKQLVGLFGYARMFFFVIPQNFDVNMCISKFGAH